MTTSNLTLPDTLPFPQSGSAEYTQALSLAESSVLRLGELDSGQPLDWDLNRFPHGLILGGTGMGKSQLVDVILNYVEALPHLYEVTVIDPTSIQHLRARDFENFRGYAVDLDDITPTLEGLVDEMARRESTLSTFKVRNLTELRDLADSHPKVKEQVGDIKRHLLVFEGLLALFNPAKVTGHDADTSTARKALAHLAQRGRRSGIHIVAASQLLENDPATQLVTEHLGFRVAMGRQTDYSWKTAFPGRAPLDFDGPMPAGRGWVSHPDLNPQLVQIFSTD